MIDILYELPRPDFRDECYPTYICPFLGPQTIFVPTYIQIGSVIVHEEVTHRVTFSFLILVILDYSRVTFIKSRIG